jgi:hypothetical protein
VRGRGVADPGVEPHRPILPLLPTTPRRQSHDYARHGTTNLYAALNLASGLVVSQMTPRHRAVGFKRFLARIDQALPAELDVHVIVDNSSTHKTPAIRRWLLVHPRFHVHFTPTYSSWLNLVERWFAELTTRWLQRGTHRSVGELTGVDPVVDRHLERRPAAVCVDQDRRRGPRKPHQIPPPNPWDRTL